MATKVKIKNFQSIESADLSIDGFTVITGKNNSGKSAVQRAIRGVFQNTRGNSFVRHGASHSEVSIEFDDGNSVLWEKGKKENKYTINGKEYDKVGSGTPEPLDDFNVQPITAGGREIWSQFAPQFTGQVFLLNETGSVLAEAISDVERVQTLNKAMKQSERDKRSATSTLKVRKKDEKALEKELDHYKGLDALGLLLDTIESLETKVDKIGRAIDKLIEYRDERLGLDGLISQLSGISQIEIIDTEEIESVCASLTELEALRDSYVLAVRGVEQLRGISQIEIPELGDITRLSEDLEELSEIQHNRNRAIKGASLMTAMCEDLENNLVILGKTDFLQKTYDALDSLEDLQRERDDLNDQLATLESEIQKNKREQVSLQQHLKDHIHGEGECPLCGSEVC